MSATRIVVLSAGISEPSSTRLLADRLTRAVIDDLAARGAETEVSVVELRDHAHDIMNAMLTGFPPKGLAEVMERVAAADALIAVTPIFSTSYSGLFKSFVDVLDRDAIEGTPVLLGATAGTPRHSLALDYALRPMFTYLHAVVAPTGVFAATGDWGASADSVKTLPDRIDRAARELAALVAASDRSSMMRDPFALERPFGHLIGGLAGE